MRNHVDDAGFYALMSPARNRAEEEEEAEVHKIPHKSKFVTELAENFGTGLIQYPP